MTRHHYGISTLLCQTAFRGKTSGGVEKCLLEKRLVSEKCHTTGKIQRVLRMEAEMWGTGVDEGTKRRDE